MLNGFNCALNVNHVLNAANKPSYDLRTWGSSLTAGLIGINRLYGYSGEYVDSQRTSVVLGRNDKNYRAIKFVWFKNQKAPRSIELNEFLSESGLNKGIPVGSVIITYLFYGGDNGCNISYGASGHTGIVGDVGDKNMVSGNNGKVYQASDLQNIILYHSNWGGGIGNVSHQNQWVPDPWITLMFGENENKRIVEDYQVNSKFSTIRPDNRCFDKMEIIIPKNIWNEYSMTSSTDTSTIEHHLPSNKAGRQNIHY